MFRHGGKKILFCWRRADNLARGAAPRLAASYLQLREKQASTTEKSPIAAAYRHAMFALPRASGRIGPSRPSRPSLH